MNKNAAFKLGCFFGRSNCFNSKLVHWVRQCIAWLVSIMLSSLHNSFSKQNFTLYPIHEHSCCDISFVSSYPMRIWIRQPRLSPTVFFRFLEPSFFLLPFSLLTLVPGAHLGIIHSLFQRSVETMSTQIRVRVMQTLISASAL